jgi:GTP-binding protein
MKNISREKARELFTSNSVFVAGADSEARLPKPFMPEIAFIGRSNVGKSSLINALTSSKMLARVSNTPGRTQQLNFFRLADRFMLVDMPGYGFAKAEKSAVADWNDLIDAYLQNRTTLKRLCLLIDARHGAKDNDRAFMETIGAYGLPFVVVLTKIDKIKVKEAEAVTAATKELLTQYGAAWPEIFPTSSEKNEGIDALRYFLAGNILE